MWLGIEPPTSRIPGRNLITVLSGCCPCGPKRNFCKQIFCKLQTLYFRTFPHPQKSTHGIHDTTTKHVHVSTQNSVFAISYGHGFPSHISHLGKPLFSSPVGRPVKPLWPSACSTLGLVPQSLNYASLHWLLSKTEIHCHSTVPSLLQIAVKHDILILPSPIAAQVTRKVC